MAATYWDKRSFLSTWRPIMALLRWWRHPIDKVAWALDLTDHVVALVR